MDTVELGFESSEIAQLLATRLRERVRSTKLRKTWHDKLTDSEGTTWRGNSAYEVQIGGYFQDRFLYFAALPRLADMPAAKLNFHASHFGQFQQLCGWLEDLLGDLYSSALDARIRRIDLCIDLGVSYEFIQQNLARPKAVRCDQYRARRRSIYLGTRPSVAYAYEKELESDVLDYVAPEFLVRAKLGRVSAVRIEISLIGQKVPIRTIREVSRLRECRPFSCLQLKRVDSTAVAVLPDAKKRNIWAYLLRASQVGAQQARRDFNRGRNFHRDIGRYLSPVPDMDLNDTWIRRFDRYFGRLPLSFRGEETI